ncbi:hypothetical protein [Enterovibrio norvegicus]|uniref:hypothetical protein n=1 Tax=Enterovibrio norvegicus TaxID=188144 RepID=UPI00352DFC99
MKELINKLQTESDHVGLPIYYKEDMVDDFNKLEKLSYLRYLWVLKKAGTQLFPIGVGVHPSLITEYCDDGSDNRYYELDVKNCSYREITASECVELAHQLPSMTSHGVEIVEHAIKVCSNPAVYNMAFINPKFDIEKAGLLEWSKFYRQVDNPVMMQFLAKIETSLENRRKAKAA